jgi:hypothetical protein
MVFQSLGQIRSNTGIIGTIRAGKYIYVIGFHTIKLLKTRSRYKSENAIAFSDSLELTGVNRLSGRVNFSEARAELKFVSRPLVMNKIQQTPFVASLY